MFFVLLLNSVRVSSFVERAEPRCISHLGAVGKMGRPLAFEFFVEVVGAVLDQVLWFVKRDVFDQSVDFSLVRGI